ncbi:MAG: M48 family metallopeptidase [Chloroflexi bacterium]|nr:M48 family metallopeptidase [Chloroflexota bacterium]
MAFETDARMVDVSLLISMNTFSCIILFALLFEFTLGLAANMLNLKALKLEPPALLNDIYTADAYRKSQEYTRENTRFGFISGAFNLVLLLAFWFSGGFNWLDQLIRSWGFTDIMNGLLYMGILSLAYSLIALPFSVYATFVIEERYGFNKTGPRTFILDRLKGLGLAVLLGAPLLAGILALFQYAGAYAWLFCWAAVTIYSLVIEFIAPTWIMPLFNKFTPMQPGELRDSILSYAGSVDFPVQNIFVMDGSRRSSKSNAFFTGFGRNKRIALFDTLIAQHTVDELVAVLAHEIGHYKKKHVLQGVVLGILHAGLIFFLLSLFLGSPGLYQAFYLQQPSIYAGLIFFGLLYTPIEMILDISLNMLSRKNEYEADRFAALTITDRTNMTQAFKKLAGNNLSNLTPHPFYAFLNYTHPPLLQRVQAIQRCANRT